MQHLGNSDVDDLEKVDYFIKEICKLNPDDFEPLDKALAFKEWSESLVVENEEAPLSFKLGGRTFKSCYIQLKDRQLENLLDMQLAFLYELSNLDYDISTYSNIDNVCALMYREDWSKDFDVTEYLDNAIFFNKQKLKFSLYGMEKYNNLIVTLKATYPILYDDSDETSVKSDGRRMFDVINAVSKDSPIHQDAAKNTKISNVFEWMEQKKIESINQKLNNGNK